ncbi:MAG TPA: sigma-70 family RNA polymerase sigma factor [Spirochaetota bacterium]|jgi:RNA polymerase sigma-70 factor (ECF subfamily)|nr:sigma-70 family RNA polymerase sigma factor [Spirochaetota bacterium]HOK93776.1 sigma-70 family RNA polymerase sigma factor [Spirochaetota bacterium]HON17342.1 sigma-70 family RNA polymerase sigma factor [Spirochaetota bacterium]HPX91830.1 sigma-70 family RNA polymerase sigma factor [Spirochaetota bacterium]HRS64022.1 sigma-70 family RNA polymerase sigma factor [Spirochaetota bacterium]
MPKKENFEIQFEAFYKKYFLSVAKYTFSLCKDLYLAEDITHDVFLRIYKNKNIPSGKEEHVKSYMFKAAKNMFIDYHRAQEAERKKEECLILEWKFKEIDPCSIIIEGEVIATISDVLNSFSPNSREIFYQRFLGKHRREIAREKNISSYYIKKIEDAIIHKLRTILKKYFGDLKDDL